MYLPEYVLTHFIAAKFCIANEIQFVAYCGCFESDCLECSTNLWISQFAKSFCFVLWTLNIQKFMCSLVTYAPNAEPRLR